MGLKVLVVDDSALMRKHLTSLLASEGFEIRAARNGREALSELGVFQPDVITLDINMPEMDGLTTLSHIMTERPTPTVMVSSLTKKGALATFEALALGAVDYIAKPGGTISLSIDDIARRLVEKVNIAARARVKGRIERRLTDAPATARPLAAQAAPMRARARAYATQPAAFGLVLVGVSTGGPRTLEEILSGLPANLPWPVLIAQHLPAAFTASLANRLNGVCPLNVEEATNMKEILPGNIYIGRGGSDLAVARRGGRLVMLNQPESPDHNWHPSVEILVSTALDNVPPKSLVAVQLTGMGNDGAEAMAELKAAGGRTIAESEETAVVFGMPAELIKRGGASCVLPSGRIADQIRLWLAH